MAKKGSRSGLKTSEKENRAADISEGTTEDVIIEQTGKKKLTFGSVLKRILLALLLLFFLAGTVAGLWFYNKYGKRLLELKTVAERIVSGTTSNDFKSSQTSICYYSDGSVMQVMRGDKDVYYLEYNAIPQYAVKAMLATEDRKFYTHKGYDVYAIARAAKAYIQNDGQIRQGGSTITQQLARNIYLNNERTVERKVTEIFIAAGLEKRYTKDDIMEFYLNNIYFANGYYGLQSAAKGYFGKTAGDLSLSQIAFLCAIPNSPSSYDPRLHYDNTLTRRDSVLKQMFENNYISFDEYSTAVEEEITLIKAQKERNNYEETYTYYCAVQALMQAEGFSLRYSFTDDEDKAMYKELYDQEYARIMRNLYAKGYRIYTSINPKKQQQLQKAVDDGLEEFTETYNDGVYLMQGSGTCIDNETGFVVAIVGGRSQEYNGYTLNRAYQSPRQPGSSIKPLIVYTPAFENGYWPETLVIDERDPGGPRNSGNVYSGIIDIRYAVRVSKNTIAFRLFQEIGIDKGLSYLSKMNFASIVDRDHVPAAALGGLTYGVTSVEMASAYAAIENDGVFREPTCIMRITDAQGGDIIDNTVQYGLYANTVASTRVYQKNAARIMTDVLQTVMKQGTGRKLALTGITSAGKTGTTNDQKDGWFVGFTKYYTTGIWVGCDLPREVEDLMGNTYPEQIWHEFMTDIHEGLEDREFDGYTDTRDPASIYPVGYIDTDGDGIPDSFIEGMLDTDNDGFPDSFPEGWIDNDGDGLPDGYPAGWIDTDGDGIPDAYPFGMYDSDGDGIPDKFPLGWVDTDDDGIPDGYPEGYDPMDYIGMIDTDGDNMPDSYPYGWIDNNGDGVPDGYPYGWTDNDGDGVPDGYPYGWVDSDGDGIPDGYPAGWTDTDFDGIPDGFPEGWIDNDGDGIPDGYPIGWIDTDFDGIPDGIPEGWVDNNGDGIPDGYPIGWVDTDFDGIPDGYPAGWVDNNDDGIPDGYPLGWVDTDFDGIPDGYPAGWIDNNGDGIPDGYPIGWIDTDYDGIPDSYPAGWVDNDGDGIPDGYPIEPDDSDTWTG
ncbi:MAG: transglycosylase domain-containing protein [Lachnospiraceae bacterium]|nr:transglycosylase domain-containing protein [Lachnospiraceae bacterium]